MRPTRPAKAAAAADYSKPIVVLEDGSLGTRPPADALERPVGARGIDVLGKLIADQPLVDTKSSGEYFSRAAKRVDSAQANPPKVACEQITAPNDPSVQAVAQLNDVLARTHGRPVDIHAVRLSGDRDSKPAAFARLVRSWIGRSVVWFESTDVLAPNGVYLRGNTVLSAWTPINRFGR